MTPAQLVKGYNLGWLATGFPSDPTFISLAAKAQTKSLLFHF